MKAIRNARSYVIDDPYTRCVVPGCIVWTREPSRICSESTWDDHHWQYVMDQSLKRRKSA